MDHDDDVEHLFSWLQTPELRYREFAGAREITDTVVTWQARTNTAGPEAIAEATPTPAPGNVQLHEEYPTNQFPDQSEVVVEVEPVVRGPAMIAPMPMAPPRYEPPPPPSPAGPFALGAAGRAPPRRPIDEPVAVPPPPLIQTPAPRQAPPPPMAGPETVPVPPPLPAAAGGGLLGGAYRENSANGHGEDSAPTEHPEAPDSQQRGERSLDAVFGRLAGRNRLPDPRDRLRHIPGLGPPAGRPR